MTNIIKAYKLGREVRLAIKTSQGLEKLAKTIRQNKLSKVPMSAEYRKRYLTKIDETKRMIDGLSAEYSASTNSMSENLVGALAMILPIPLREY